MNESRDAGFVKIQVRKADHALDLDLPRYMTAGASGMDLCAAATKTIQPGEVTLVPVGLHVAVPNGFELQVRPRSGLAAKKGLGVLNSPGTIDSDYRGEIKVILVNLGSEPFRVDRGERIAQMVLCPVYRAELEETLQLPASMRSEGGFGHTGLT